MLEKKLHSKLAEQLNNIAVFVPFVMLSKNSNQWQKAIATLLQSDV